MKPQSLELESINNLTNDTQNALNSKEYLSLPLISEVNSKIEKTPIKNKIEEDKINQRAFFFSFSYKAGLMNFQISHRI